MARIEPDVKGRWFGGDRTFEQQCMGLDRLWPLVDGKEVLDVGCAEGLITRECSLRGAKLAHGAEVREDAVAWAQHYLKPTGNLLKFTVQDANAWQPMGRYDIVLLLAVLHKLKDPSAAARRFADVARELVVIRLPPEKAPSIIDPRSGNRVHNIGVVMFAAGFDLEHVGYDGPFGEWVGYYRRR